MTSTGLEFEDCLICRRTMLRTTGWQERGGICGRCRGRPKIRRETARSLVEDVVICACALVILAMIPVVYLIETIAGLTRNR